MITSTRITLSPMGLAAAGLALLGTGALFAGRLSLPAPLAGLVLLGLALRLGVMASAVGEASRAPAAAEGAGQTRQGLLHAVHV